LLLLARVKQQKFFITLFNYLQPFISMKAIKTFSIVSVVYFFGCIFTIPHDYQPIHMDGRKIPLYKVQDRKKGVSYIYHKYKFYSKIYERFMVSISHTRKQKQLSVNFHYRGDDWIFYNRIVLMNDKKERIIWAVHNLDQNVDILKRGVTSEEINLPLRNEQVLRLERLLRNGRDVKFWFMGQEDAIFSISNDDRLANLDVIKYYKKLDLVSL